MSAPRLRAKLATPRTASEQTEEEKAKAKKAEGKEVDKDVSDNDEDDGEGVTPPKKDGKKAAAATAPVKALSPEKARMKAITGSEAAGLMPKLAAHLAYDTDLSAAEAEAVMAAALEDVDTEASEAPAQRESSATSPNGAAFRKAMNAEAPNPSLGAGGGGKGEPEDPWLAAAKSLGVA
ncbi:hypothetical protein SAMN05216360_101527 [Methylobacterium phyllostachyos]|uniref:Uncharacterized protein n=1 Tax=Methylobacterium phyllostachyos TaxID=582672 RepID=A0A1G9S9N3_9HYPH|nr:hypothetical protein [Methylobacterium phyllostachyos]SDM31495.1 hypothetical protein SAMN05216360_101527 [Methylobacterium phyllostachyos]